MLLAASTSGADRDLNIEIIMDESKSGDAS
jgi:hypothetical protein